MNKLLISYDLIAPGRDYSRLIEQIKSLGQWIKPLESTWVVATAYTAEQVRDHLVRFIDSNDKILVISVGAPAAWHNLGSLIDNWLVNNL